MLHCYHGMAAPAPRPATTAPPSLPASPSAGLWRSDPLLLCTQGHHTAMHVLTLSCNTSLLKQSLHNPALQGMSIYFPKSDPARTTWPKYASVAKTSKAVAAWGSFLAGLWPALASDPAFQAPLEFSDAALLYPLPGTSGATSQWSLSAQLASGSSLAALQFLGFTNPVLGGRSLEVITSKVRGCDGPWLLRECVQVAAVL
jgi:hypothetical protein